MKQLLFLLLFPCLAMAQYPANGNQKISLGEQTTADGLVYRGRLADTANLLTNKLDTSVYIVLDTGTRAMWYYRASTTPKWTRLVDSLNNMQGQLSLTTKVTGTLPVANGGTNTSTLTANKVMVGNGTSGVLTPTNLHWDNSNSRLGIGTASPGRTLDVNGNLAFKTSLSGEMSGTGGLIAFTQADNNAYWINITNNNNTGRFICGVEGAAGATFTGSSANSAFFGSNAGDLHIISDGAIRQTIKSTGDVGIGTASPSEKLHVVGDGLFTGNIGIGSATPTASGAGITFPATQSASTNVNTLDDYEEGTWTTTFGSQGNLTGTPVLTNGIYRKIGQLVFLEGKITGLSITSTDTQTYIQFSIPIAMNSNSTNQVGNAYTYISTTDISGVITDWTSGDKTNLGIFIPKTLVTSTGSLAQILFSISYISEN
jgi:hypothetical protein